MRRGLAAGLAAAAMTLAVVPPASASFHLMSIREVATNPAGPNSAFIELQMYASGQNFTNGHSVTFYTATGSLLATYPLTNVPNGGNQRTILIGDSEGSLSPDIGDPMFSEAVQTYGPGGAACFDSIDCVSWGSFAGAGALPSSPGMPAGAIPDGSSLTRSIAPGCATLLEAGDDMNDSLTDFALTTPSPRGNAAEPTELECDTTPPQTTITKAPDKTTEKAKAKIKFRSNEAGSEFMCKLDKGPFEACDSPFKEKVDLGKHKFRVYAIDRAGNRDPSAAKAKFKRIDG